jgi:N-terminal half of MaoC dehydratase
LRACGRLSLAFRPVPDTWITDEMRAAIGGQHSDRTSMPISVSDIRKWAQAVYYPDAPPREYWDEQYAATTPAGGIVAPEEFNPFAWMSAAGPPSREALGQGASTTERRLGVTPPATSNMLNGGLTVEYTGVHMRPGDVIRSVTNLVDYSERTGRLGLMLFTTTEDRWTNQDGELIKVQRAVLIRY